MINKPGPARPAHRPSRREEIIDAAVTVFGRAGYVAASVEDIALESGVAATAIYYHFGGKEELFNQALRTALDRLSEATYAARYSEGATSVPSGDSFTDDDSSTDGGAATEGSSAAATLRRVIRFGLARALSHPEETRFLLHQTFRPTAEARKLQQDWEERHVQRTFDYLPQPVTPLRTPREARIRHAAHLLASRVITYTTIVAQESRLAGGPLADLPMPSIVKAVEDVCVRVVSSAGDFTPTEPIKQSPAKQRPAKQTQSKSVVVTRSRPAKEAAVKKALAKAAATSTARKAAAKTVAAEAVAAQTVAAKTVAVKKAAVKKTAVKKSAAAKTSAAKATVKKKPV